MTINHRQFVNFLGLCEEKSFSKAAEKLNISQQGLGKSIKQIEDELDIVLFSRSPRGIELTEAGCVLQSSLRPYMNSYEHVLDEIKQLKTRTSQNISLGLPSTFNDLELPEDFFPNFIKSNTGVNLKIVNYFDEITEKTMLEHKLHLGFFCIPYDTQQFYSVFNHKAKLKLISGKTHRFAKKSSIKLSELKDENVICLTTSLSPLSVMFELCRQNGAKMDTVLSPGDVNLHHILCNTGRYVAFGASHHTVTADLVTIDIEDIELYWEYNLVVNKFIFLTGAEEKFIAYAKKKLQGHRNI
ncbi:LysR family transcriptional regulator [Spirochaetia bacterium]|nr:LysR family transcriptional regulator [Spirochaetia bacterium]